MTEHSVNARQYRDQAEFIARVAAAIADNKISDGQLYAAVRRLTAAVETLAAWTPDDRK